ncbi:MAG: YraN family protein [Gammaproteobacteria bacterium]|nr:YraN family protein [Gammaproteobacteria bacterium]MDH3447234.1 YraN family protein [Gammaproteobacteria bacterium]
MIGNLRKGLRYEERARKYLEHQGLQLLQQNFRSRFGEIDLVMRDRDSICFVEVKFRGSLAFGGAANSLPRSKQRKIIRTALTFLATHDKLKGLAPRFDALLIQQQSDGSDRLEWIKNAFYAE